MQIHCPGGGGFRQPGQPRTCPTAPAGAVASPRPERTTVPGPPTELPPSRFASREVEGRLDSGGQAWPPGRPLKLEAPKACRQALGKPLPSSTSLLLHTWAEEQEQPQPQPHLRAPHSPNAWETEAGRLPRSLQEAPAPPQSNQLPLGCQPQPPCHSAFSPAPARHLQSRLPRTPCARFQSPTVTFPGHAPSGLHPPPGSQAPLPHNSNHQRRDFLTPAAESLVVVPWLRKI